MVDHSGEKQPSQAAGASHRLALDLAACAMVWLPCFWVLGVYAPRFKPIFQRLSLQAELPAASRFIMQLADFDTTYSHAPVVLGFIGLLLVDLAVVRRLERGHRGKSLWAWFAAVTVSGITASVIVVWGLVAPVYSLDTVVP